MMIVMIIIVVIVKMIMMTNTMTIIMIIMMMIENHPQPSLQLIDLYISFIESTAASESQWVIVMHVNDLQHIVPMHFFGLNASECLLIW
jgi:hypothetical protein